MKDLEIAEDELYKDFIIETSQNVQITRTFVKFIVQQKGLIMTK